MSRSDLCPRCIGVGCYTCNGIGYLPPRRPIDDARDAVVAAALDAFDGDGPLPVKLADAVAAYRKATEET